LCDGVSLLGFLSQCRDVACLALCKLHSEDREQHQKENRLLGVNLRNLTPLD
jgi:hypothetical protein